MIPFQTGRGMIATSTGYFDLAAPRPDDVDLRDIALALSRINRFTGHGRGVVSVARHSINCYREARARNLPGWLCGVVLMHDAAEAYVGDVSRPLKNLLPDFKLIEMRVWNAIRTRFGLPMMTPAVIKKIDDLACITEARDLFPAHEPWPGFPALGFSFRGAYRDREFCATRDASEFLVCAGRAGIK